MITINNLGRIADVMLSIGMALTLESLEDDNGEKYKCKVADIDGDKIYIDYPISLTTNRTAFLVNSLQLNVVFTSENNVAFRFKSEVLGKVKKNIPLIILHLPSEDHFIKIQRRQFVRVEVAVDSSLYFPDTNLRFTTMTADISAGGCAVFLPKEMDQLPDEIGEIILVLPMQSGKYHYIRSKMKHIRVWKESGRNIASLEFIDIQEKETQLLFRFCFEKQLEFRKKGLLTK